MSKLSQDQLDFFEENGYLVLENLFSPEEVKALQHESDYLLELMLNSSLMHQRLSGRLDWLQTSQDAQVVRKIQPVNDLSLAFTKTIADQRIVDPLRQIMGEKPVLMEEKLNYKQPLPQKVEGLPIKELDDYFPVHNDWAYYAAQNYPQSVLSSALLLDECTPNNGPLRIWPGSHKKHLEHERMENGLQINPALIDHGGGIDMLAPAGTFMIFHVLVVHNSRPNTSGRPRRLMIYSHYPESFEMPFDVRNSPSRLREAPWEREYMRAKERGDYQDTFQAPTYL
ncbi:MAG: ectoine hydroxylase-related dioxygenase (phytanoyl-CoA dioxygenase family) [Candidatus Latescibacterota bacterium]|jgi:ectoine hydroxylase-related dioxygenase (phytanoyl-CoA dioxygenase family)